MQNKKHRSKHKVRRKIIPFTELAPKNSLIFSWGQNLKLGPCWKVVTILINVLYIDVKCRSISDIIYACLHYTFILISIICFIVTTCFELKISPSAIIKENN